MDICVCGCLLDCVSGHFTLFFQHRLYLSFSTLRYLSASCSKVKSNSRKNNICVCVLVVVFVVISWLITLSLVRFCVLFRLISSFPFFEVEFADLDAYFIACGCWIIISDVVRFNFNVTSWFKTLFFYNFFPLVSFILAVAVMAVAYFVCLFILFFFLSLNRLPFRIHFNSYRSKYFFKACHLFTSERFHLQKWYFHFALSVFRILFLRS